MNLTQLKELFTDEDAVSPVIGVILMVAITVILAAVIGTFVLGLGENVQDSAPQANFQFEYSGGSGDSIDTASGTADEVSITHTGGEDISQNTLSVNIGGTTVYENGEYVDAAADFGTGSPTTNWDTTVQTGSTLTLIESSDEDADADGIYAGATVRVVWTSPSGGTSNTIGQSTVPS